MPVAGSQWAEVLSDLDRLVARRLKLPERPYSSERGLLFEVTGALYRLGCRDFGLDWGATSGERPMFVMNVPRHLSGSRSVGMPDPVVMHAATPELAVCMAVEQAIAEPDKALSA